MTAALAKGISMQGGNAVVESFNMYQEIGKNISFYDFYAFGIEAAGFFGGKLPPVVYDFIKACGNVSGKRCFCFVGKKGMRNGKTLAVLMQMMEAQGVFISNFEIISNPAMAQAIGKRLKLARD